MKTLSLALVAALASCPGPAVEGPGTGTKTVQGSTADAIVVPAPSDEGTALEIRPAIRRSLPFLEDQGVAWMEGRVPIQSGSPCVSCHHVGYSLWSQNEARRAGVEGSGEILESLMATAVEFLGKPGIPRALSTGSVLLAEGRPEEALVKAMLDLQTDEGGWEAKGQFPTQRRPRWESDAVATLWSFLALASASEETPTLAAQTKAVALLDQEKDGTSTEWLAARLLVARALHADDQALDLKALLLARQNEDGGWGWIEEDPSEAFSTGQALYALAFFPSADPKPIQRAVAYLLRTQEEDGTWQVAASAISREPSEGKDVIYRFWGTAWATIGLSRSLRDLPAS